MKTRILNYGVDATHDLISRLTLLSEPTSISDFHAFLYNPAKLHVPGVSSTDFQRRQAEIRDLVLKKGGIVVCVLRPEVNSDPLLDLVAPKVGLLARSAVKQGTGSHLRAIPSARGVSGGYFQVLKGSLHFTAHFDLTEAQITQNGGTIFAVDSVGHPIAVEFSVGEGRICFVPPPNNIPADRMGAAVVKVITAHFNKTAQIDAPAWAGEITVPGATAHDREIVELTVRTEELAAQISSLKSDREKVLSHVRLLFAYGKGVLEPRRAFGLQAVGPYRNQRNMKANGTWSCMMASQGGLRWARSRDQRALLMWISTGNCLTTSRQKRRREGTAREY
jgi:hypothetical protein